MSDDPPRPDGCQADLGRHETPVVPDLVTLPLPPGGSVVVCSDLHLGSQATEASLAAAAELARRIEDWRGPGALVLAGDTFELWAEAGTDPGPALDAHPVLAAVLEEFARSEGHRLVVLAGNHDGRLAWDAAAADSLRRRLRAEVAIAADIDVAPGAGCARPRRIRVEHGHQLDPHNAFVDPHSPLDRPFGFHVARLIVPALEGRTPQGTTEATDGGRADDSGTAQDAGASGGVRAADRADGPGWLDGLHSLDDPGDAAAMVGSRLVYRRLAAHLWWLAVPFVVVAALRLPLILAALTRQEWLGDWAGQGAHLALEAGLAVLADLVLVSAAIGLVARRSFRALASLDIGPRGTGQNDAARARAAELVGQGYAGYVSGHTHQPELSAVGDGFYANAGCAGRVVARRRTRLGLPPVYLAVRQTSFLLLDHEPSALVARLVYRRSPERDGTWLERLVAAPDPLAVPQSAVVASYPAGTSWPLPPGEPPSPSRKPRRIAALALGLAGVVDLVSALTPPLRARLAGLGDVVPLAVPEAAGALAALAGVGLLLLSRGVRRGQRQAWLGALVLLGASVLLHVAKGLDVEEASVALAVGGYLLHHRRHFRISADRAAWARGLAPVVAATSGVVALAAVLAEVAGARQPVAVALAAAGERLAGVQTLPMHGALGGALGVVLLPVGVMLAGLAGLVLVRPARASRWSAREHDAARGRPAPLRGSTEWSDDRAQAPCERGAGAGRPERPGRRTGGSVHRADGGTEVAPRERARDIVGRHGGDTLAYFALRDDKDLFFWRDSVVAYAVHHGVCLVSPDPVGPAGERPEVWAAFRAFADGYGWAVAVVGASADWLPLYRRDGLTDRYIGDEAVVDVRRFRLEGKRNKALRQAVNRVARHGYTAEFHDPALVGEPLVGQLRELVAASRRGDVERGFSMTLSRVFDPSDRGLLLAVARDADGRPAAFCQFVPAPGINGWSLDVMRRSGAAHPNGLTDFLIVETIRHLQATGATGLGLNFAAMRAVVAGEAGSRLERRLLEQLSETMQIESLWRFNAKFHPDWHPRFLIVDGAEHLPAAGAAVARAESLWELPVLGKFLRRGREPAGRAAAEHAAATPGG